MVELFNEKKTACGYLDLFHEGGDSWVIIQKWYNDVDGMPSKTEWEKAFNSVFDECARKGAKIIDTRVISAEESIDDELSSERAKMHREILSAKGFVRGEGRIEFRLPLDTAVKNLESSVKSNSLRWECLDSSREDEFQKAVHFFQCAAEGDIAFDPDDEMSDFLKGFLADEDAIKAPEMLQVGIMKNEEAAVIACYAFPDGWSTIYYLGILPQFRGRGLGAETMLQGLQTLKKMGGKIYQDGTGARNKAALALFAKIKAPLFREMEDWRLKL